MSSEPPFPLCGRGATVGRLLGLVVAQEQLLHGRGLTDEAAQPERGKVAEHPVQLLGVYLEPRPPALDGEAVDPGELAEARDRLGELRLDGGAGEVAKLGQSPALDRLAVADDRDPITQEIGRAS